MTRYYIRNSEGKLYVRMANCGIHPMVILVDALPISTFRGFKSPFLSVEVVLEWHKKELEYGLRNGYNQKSIDLHRAAIKNFTECLEVKYNPAEMKED